MQTGRCGQCRRQTRKGTRGRAAEEGAQQSQQMTQRRRQGAVQLACLLAHAWLLCASLSSSTKQGDIEYRRKIGMCSRGYR